MKMLSSRRYTSVFCEHYTEKCRNCHEVKHKCPLEQKSFRVCFTLGFLLPQKMVSFLVMPNEVGLGLRHLDGPVDQKMLEPAIMLQLRSGLQGASCLLDLSTCYNLCCTLSSSCMCPGNLSYASINPYGCGWSFSRI